MSDDGQRSPPGISKISTTLYGLQVVAGQHLGANYRLEDVAISIGRDPSNVICLEDWGVSKQHARIEPAGGSWVIEDLNSTNGVVVNGRKVHRVPLESGFEIRIGEAKLRVVSEIQGGDEGQKGTTLNPPSGHSDLMKGPPDRGSEPDLADAAAQERHDAVRKTGGTSAAPAVPEEETAAIEHLRQAREKLKLELGKVVIGQHEVLDQLLIALFSRGHCLMVGVPGLAKTLMVRTLGQILELDSKRIQFTPDLMPSDITGTQILEEDPATRQRSFRFMRGPIFTNILLADEINRTPPKTQAALLEAMQEGRVTAGGTGYQLAKPFFVLATQNPIEQEGTYPLPEAQLDRFMFMIKMGYPSRDEEMEIYRATTGDAEFTVRPVLSGEAILRLQHLVRRVPVSDHVMAYTADLVRATRPEDGDAREFVKEWLSWGAGPRAGQYLLLAAKSRSLLHGRTNVNCEDIRAVAHPVLRHRLFCNFNATSEGIHADNVIDRLLKETPEPTERSYKR